MTQPTSRFSLVTEIPAAAPEQAYAHFANKLAYETDPADVMLDLQRGQRSFVIIDSRSEKAFQECHIPGAVHLPTRQINEESTRHLSKEQLFVVYCWGPACNGATRACAKLSKLGFRVKEMIGGIEYWRKEGGPVEGTMGTEAPLYG
ncbi:rhodanese-like domain-containing protein [Brevibacillus migulae]|uniref:rhodanese-like domain-containing protein n=1 Tax=Brevibacillus migulae TaxID=1644114 RepID=UPI00106EBAC3|nr:rhodanese-like domain-containing protein [Brevibacillus migulae]